MALFGVRPESVRSPESVWSPESVRSPTKFSVRGLVSVTTGHVTDLALQTSIFEQ